MKFQSLPDMHILPDVTLVVSSSLRCIFFRVSYRLHSSLELHLALIALWMHVQVALLNLARIPSHIPRCPPSLFQVSFHVCLSGICI